MTEKEINQFKELITEALSEAMSKLLSKSTDSPEKTEDRAISSLIDIQRRRSAICQDLANASPSTNADELEEKLRKLPKTITWDDDLQEIVDDFDYWHAVELAKLCGFQYYDPSIGHEVFPTVGHLVEDALEMARGLREVKCGRLQRGRLIMSKFWDEKQDESWYTLTYFLEHQENY